MSIGNRGYLLIFANFDFWASSDGRMEVAVTPFKSPGLRNWPTGWNVWFNCNLEINEINFY